MSQPRFGGEAYFGRNCLGVDAELFFPEGSDSPEESERAKAVCSGCVVRDACLEYAIVNVIRQGVWGGTSEKERRRIRRARRLAAS